MGKSGEPAPGLTSGAVTAAGHDEKASETMHVEGGQAGVSRTDDGVYRAEQSSTSLGRWLKERARERQLAILRRFVPDTASAILEIGPGWGELTQLFLAAGYRDYTVIEPNAVMRERLAAMGVATRDYAIPEIREDDSCFDAVVLFNVFEHLNGTPEAEEFLSHVHRVLRPGGHVCVLSPDYLHWGHDFFNGDSTHSNITTVRRSAQLLHDRGFQVLQHTYFSGPLSGLFATGLSFFVRLALFMSAGNNLNSRIYRLKTTLLRTFLLIGRKA